MNIKSFVQNVFVEIIAGVIILIITVLASLISKSFPEDNPVKLFVSSYPIVFSITTFVLLFLFFMLFVIARKNKKLKNELQLMCAKNADFAKANGFALYKDFAYYKPEVGPSELYCKYCIEDNKQIRRLTGSGVFFDCTSCGNRAIDRQLQDRLQEESDRNNPARFL